MFGVKLGLCNLMVNMSGLEQFDSPLLAENRINFAKASRKLATRLKSKWITNESNNSPSYSFIMRDPVPS